MKTWTINLWDGNSTNTFQRKGTYESVVNSLAGYPPSYIWNVQ